MNCIGACAPVLFSWGRKPDAFDFQLCKNNGMSQQAQPELVRLSDLPLPVALNVPARVRGLLAELLRGWRFKPWPGEACEPVLAMEMTPAGRFVVTGRWVPEVKDRSDVVDAACGFIAELIRAYVNEVPDRLCLHAAGAVCGGRLLVFLGTRRAGKSVLCAAMAAAGMRLAGDDILMIDAADGSAVAGGFSPRLRLPLPESLAPATRAFIDAHSGATGRQYAYLDLGTDLIASKDERFDIGAFIILDRKQSAPTVLRPIAKSASLSAVIWQNFARHAPSADILDRLYSLVEQSGTCILEYSAAEEAVQLLQDRFAIWPADGPARVFADAAAAHAGEAEAPGPAVPAAAETPASGPPPTCRFRRRSDVAEREIEGRFFLADNEGGTITVLNTMAAAIWRALAEPATAAELVELADLAFPDTGRAVIQADVAAVLRDFVAEGLIIEP
jgi:hypothetical protein